MNMQKFRVCVERPHEPAFYLFVDVPNCGDAIRKVMGMVDTTGAKLVVEPAGSDRARELALKSSRVLVEAYDRRRANGDTMTLGAIDDACALARQALAALGESPVATHANE
jgi:hypothetical protein